MTVPPGRAVEVPFRVRPEAGAGPGDHFGGIVAINERDLRAPRQSRARNGFSLRYLPRLAIAVQVTTPGKATFELGAGGLGIDVTPSSSYVTVLLRNAGNKLIKQTTGHLVVSEDGQVLLRRSVDIGAFVPGTTIRYRLPLEGTPSKGRYRVRGQLLPAGAPAVPVDGSVSFGDKAAAELRSESGVEAKGSGPSALILAALAGAGLLVAMLALALVSARRRLGQARAQRG